jgi:hypothetical protein
LAQFSSCLLLGTTGGHLLALDLDFVHHVRTSHRIARAHAHDRAETDCVLWCLSLSLSPATGSA